MILFYLKLILIGVWILLTSILFFPFVFVFWGHPNRFKWYLNLFIPFALFVLGIKIRPIGIQDTRPLQPCIYIGNHQHALDFLIFPSLNYDRALTIGKKEMAYVPLFGWIYALSGQFMIDRSKKRESVQRLQQVAQRMKNENLSVAIFPEGTRNKTGNGGFLPFKKGAFHLAIDSQLPIVPMVASPVSDVIDLKAGKIHPGTVDVMILDPIPTQGLTNADVNELCEKTRTLMLNQFEKFKAERAGRAQ